MKPRCFFILCFVALGSAVSAIAQIPLPPSVNDATFGPLISGNVYVANQNVSVPGGTTLTVQAGVVVKFALDREMTVSGTLDVLATPANPSFFTSLRDDSVGGITDLANPAPGDWKGILFGGNADASQLRSCVVRYAGGNVTGAIRLIGADITIDDAAIELSASDGIDAAAGPASLPAVTRSRFEGNVGFPVNRLVLAALAGFSDNTATGNGVDAIRITASSTVGSQTVSLPNVINGLLVVAGGITVNSGHTLTLGPGLVLKWQSPAGVTVSGVLVTDGNPSAPVVLTSLADDAIGGDANGDGPSSGAPGDWKGIVFGGNADASALRSTSVRFAGFGQVGALVLLSADVSLTDVAVESSASDGLNSGGSLPSVTRCRFDNGLGRAIDEQSWASLARFEDNAASGNLLGQLTRIAKQNLTGTSRVDPWNTLNGDGVIVADVSTAVLSNQALILGAGLIVKFSNPNASGFVASGISGVGSGVLHFDGRGYDPIVLTTIQDDEVGGDTNGDGVATTPQPGTWGAVRYLSLAGPAQMNHTMVRYGGRNLAAAVVCQSPNVSLDAVRVERSISDGFNIANNGGGMRNLVALGNLADGIVVQATAVSILHATSTANLGRGVVSEGSHTGSLSASIAWGNGIGAADNVVGFGDKFDLAQRVFFTDGSAGHDDINGNFVADPLFVAPSQGDLTLSLFSPCVGTAGFPNGAFTYEDHAGNSRVLDHNLFGFALPDMGAYEYYSYTMLITGAPRIGTSLTFRVEGQPFQGNPPGTALMFLGTGFNGVGVFLPPFGNANVLQPGGLFLPLFAFPTSTTVTLPIPDSAGLVGFGVGLQALVRPLANPAVGNWATAFYGVVSD